MNELQNIVPEGKLTIHEFREWITGIEQRMSACDGALDRHTEDSPIKLSHTFTPGLYAREINMPENALIISRIHLHEHPFIISKGTVSVYDGENVVTLTAPYSGITKPGAKRLLFVHEDTTWTTFHVTDKTTFEEIDEDGVITCGDYKDLDRVLNKEIAI